jgi:hypothetical protein
VNVSLESRSSNTQPRPSKKVLSPLSDERCFRQFDRLYTWELVSVPYLRYFLFPPNWFWSPLWWPKPKGFSVGSLYFIGHSEQCFEFNGRSRYTRRKVMRVTSADGSRRFPMEFHEYQTKKSKNDVKHRCSATTLTIWLQFEDRNRHVQQRNERFPWSDRILRVRINDHKLADIPCDQEKIEIEISFLIWAKELWLRRGMTKSWMISKIRGRNVISSLRERLEITEKNW